MRGVADRLGVALDFVSDWAVLCFASWTLIAYVGMITAADVDFLTPLWLLTTPLLAAFLLVLRRRTTREETEADEPPSAPAESATEEKGRNRRTLFVIALVAGLVTAALAAHPGRLPWTVVWIPAFVAAAAAVLADKLRSRSPAILLGTVGWPAHAFAAGVGLFFGLLSLFTARGNADDTFYVNRATAVHDLGHIPVLDVIFTHEEVARAGGAGLPVDSYSALQGAAARLIGVEAPSVSYFLFPPVFTFLATWAVWRLIRMWTPRNAVLCFVLGSVFWVWSAQYPLTSGSYFLARIWQGKVALVAWLVPTLYVYLTRWMGKRDAATAVLLLAAALCSIGLTGSATFVIPLVALAAVIPILACMDWRALPVTLAVGAIPFAIGMFALLRYPLAEAIGTGELPSQAWFYHQTVGSGLVALVAAFGIWAAPWIARSGPAERLTTGLAVVVALLIIPGSIAFFADISGLGGTLRRLLWIVPFPALVGLLAAVPLWRRAGRLVPVGVTIVVSALLIAFGTPLWILTGRNVLHYPPKWHVSEVDTARAILRHYDGDKPILADKTLMVAISIITAEPKAVNARTHYLKHTRLSRQQKLARITLTNFIMAPQPQPTPAVRRALAYLDVGLVCVSPNREHVLQLVEGLGPFQEAFRARRAVCAERLPTSG